MRVSLIKDFERNKPNITTASVLSSFTHSFFLDLSPFLPGIVSITLEIILQDKMVAF